MSRYDNACPTAAGRHSVLQHVRSAISQVSEGMSETEPSELTWPVAPEGVQVVPRWLREWKERHNPRQKGECSITLCHSIVLTPS